MIRKFRAIVQSNTEPEDHEVVWAYKGKLLKYEAAAWGPIHELEVDEIPYTTEEDPSIKTLKDVLDNLTYNYPTVTFKLAQSGTYEKGTVITKQEFSWVYSKSDSLLVSQSINGHNLDTTLRAITTNENISTNTTWTIKIYDGKNTASASVSISFVEYLYYCTGTELTTMKKATGNTVSVVAGEGEYIYVFVPKTRGYSKIMFEGKDSTADFTAENYTCTSSTGRGVKGTLYKSINFSLGNVTLQFT